MTGGPVGAASADAFTPGTHGCHEALHLAYVFADLVDRHLVEHPAVQGNTRWCGLATQAASALAKLYQEIGAVHLAAPISSCCGGTGLADYAAVPCTNPSCAAERPDTADIQGTHQ